MGGKKAAEPSGVKYFQRNLKPSKIHLVLSVAADMKLSPGLFKGFMPFKEIQAQLQELVSLQNNLDLSQARTR